MHPVSTFHRTQKVFGIMPELDGIQPLTALKTREGYYAEIYQDHHRVYKAKVLFAPGEVHTLDVVADGMRKIWQKIQDPSSCISLIPVTGGKRALYVGNYGLMGGMPPKFVAGLSQEELQKYFDATKVLSRLAYSAGTLKQANMPVGYRLIDQTKPDGPGNLMMIAAEEISTGRTFVLTGGTIPSSLKHILSDICILLQIRDLWIDTAREFVQKVKNETDNRPIFSFGGHSKAQAISEPMAYENDAYCFTIEGPGTQELLDKCYGPLNEKKTDKFFSFNAESMINTWFKHVGHSVKVDLTEAGLKDLLEEKERLAKFEQYEEVYLLHLLYPEALEYDYQVPIGLSKISKVFIEHPLDNIANIHPNEFERMFSQQKPKPNILKITNEYVKNPANWTTKNDGIYPMCFDAYPAFLPQPLFKFSVERVPPRPRALSHIEEYALSLYLSFNQSDGFYHHPPGRHSYDSEYTPWFEALIKILPLLTESAEIKIELDRLFRLHREMLIAITDLCICRAQPIVFSSSLKFQRLAIEDKLKEINRIILQICTKLPRLVIPGLFPLQRVEKLHTERVIQDWHVRITFQNEVYGSFDSHRGGARERTGKTFAGFYEKEAWHVGNKQKHNSILRKYIQFPKQFTLILKADGKPDRSILLSRPGPSGRSLSYDPISFDIRDDKIVLCLRSLPTEFIVEDTTGQNQRHGYRCNRGIFRSNDRARIEVINLLTGATIYSLEFASDFPRRVEFVNGNEISVEYDNGKQSILEFTPRAIRLTFLLTKQHESLKKLEALAKNGQWQHLQMQTDNPDSAFDDWMFPIDYPSNRYGDQYTVSRADIDALKINPLWMNNYRKGIILVATSWGWDLENEQDLTSSVQCWTGYRIRLLKMHRSLFLFGQNDLLQALDRFAAPIFPTEILSPVASASSLVSASSEAGPSSKAAQKEPEEEPEAQEIADQNLTQDDGESERVGIWACLASMGCNIT